MEGVDSLDAAQNAGTALQKRKNCGREMLTAGMCTG